MKFKEVFGLWFTLFLKLFGIAVLFGLIGYSFNLPIFGMFLIGFIFNFITGTAFSYYYGYKHEKLLAQQNKDILDYESRRTAKVNCAYCHAENIVPIDLSNTKFSCSKCKKTNRLVAEFMAAQITVPQSTNAMISGAEEN